MPVDAYADSSFLVSLLRVDSSHEAAMRYMAQCGETLAFREIEQDLRAGLLIYTRVSWTDVFRLADELSDKHSGKEGQRTIDLLHVALALECGAKTFLSFDRRQRSLAKAANLIVKPLLTINT
jgi:hypothetical protein